MKHKTICVECACGHSHEILKPENEHMLDAQAEGWADRLCPNCELNGNDDMDWCEVHNVFFKLGSNCWKCDYKR